MNLGFVVPWLPDRRQTWSGIPYSLLAALQSLEGAAGGAVTDIDTMLPVWKTTLHKLIHLRPHNGRLTSTYCFAHGYLRDMERKMNALLHTQALVRPLDALLQIGDIGIPRPHIPFFCYQDASVRLLMRWTQEQTAEHNFSHISLEQMRRRDEWQTRYYEQASGLFTFSQWLADSLINEYGIARERVHVVQAGCNVRSVRSANEALPTHHLAHDGVRRVLFVGRDFKRKAGDVVVEAVRLLHREYAGNVRLVLAGPKEYPLGAVPEFVEFVGDAPWSELQSLFASADVFCMPSRFEAFGIVFAEALCAGVPCIGRNACAMPELIEHGVTGFLLERDDPHELAALIVQTLEHPTMRQTVRDRAPALRKQYSWERVARDMMRVMGQEFGA
jgi:glycosyltransferase involved in cell wall biosynthesis